MAIAHQVMPGSAETPHEKVRRDRTAREQNPAAVLEILAAARQRQLDALPAHDTDVVAAAHRASVARILESIRRAQARITDGTYGTCLSCGGRIDDARQERHPWTAVCARCPERP